MTACANTKCKWHRPGGGCRLFAGQAWQACRSAVTAKTPSRPAPKAPRPLPK